MRHYLILFFLSGILALTFSRAHCQSNDINYSSQLKQLNEQKAAAEKKIFDGLAVVADPLKPGETYFACDLFPGPGYKCRTHGRQCCPICQKTYDQRIKNCDDSFTAKINQASADFQRTAQSQQAAQQTAAPSNNYTNSNNRNAVAVVNNVNQNLNNQYQRNALSASSTINNINNIAQSYVNSQRKQAQPVAGQSTEQETAPQATNNSANTAATVNNSLLNLPAPDFSSTQSNGSPFRLSDYSGKKLILIFWSSVDQKSVDENKKISNDYGFLTSKGYRTISYSQEFSRYQWHTAITDNNLNGIQISDLNGKDNDSVKNYHVTQYPTIILIDESGRVISVANNYETIKNNL